MRDEVAADFVRIGLIPACAFPVAFRQRRVETGDFLLQLRTLLLGAGLLARHFLGDDVWTFQDALDPLPDLPFDPLGTQGASTAQGGIGDVARGRANVVPGVALGLE